MVPGISVWTGVVRYPGIRLIRVGLRLTSWRMYLCQAVVRGKYDLIDLALSGVESFRNLSPESSRIFLKHVSPLILTRRSSLRVDQWGVVLGPEV